MGFIGDFFPTWQKIGGNFWWGHMVFIGDFSPTWQKIGGKISNFGGGILKFIFPTKISLIKLFFPRHENMSFYR